MVPLLDPLVSLARPLTSPFLALLVVGLMPWLAGGRRSAAFKAAFLAGVLVVFSVAYHLLSHSPGFANWLTGTTSPLIAVFLVIVLPAMYLPRNRWYKLFLLVPAAVLGLGALSVIENYRAVPPGKEGWYWLLIRPAWLMGGVASLLVLVQPLVSLADFRRLVRFACFGALVYGGMGLRANYADYQAMLDRRPQAEQDVMKLSETTPVLQNTERMTYLPSAPCRFTADGGYVQGCNMELFQRVLQVNWAELWRGEASADDRGAMRLALGALLFFLIISFLLARWFCGWLCPLSSMGDALDWIRRKLRLPHLKPVRPLKLTYLFSGAGLATLTLAMAKAQPHIDENTGRFAGCKIPLYPFCKMCPGQQICPVVSAGPDNYPGLPSWEDWAFFRTMVLVLLVVFGVSFMIGRRLWCRLCPMGIISGIFNRGGMITLRKEPGKCNRCGVCAEVCPMDIDLVRAEMTKTDVSSYDCVLCLKCLQKCPRDGCLALEHAGVRVTESRFDGKN